MAFFDVFGTYYVFCPHITPSLVQNSNCQKEGHKKNLDQIFKKMRSRKENLPIYLDIPFKEILCKEQTSYIVIELIKSLLYQRQQIPQTIDTLRIELR